MLIHFDASFIGEAIADEFDKLAESRSHKLIWFKRVPVGPVNWYFLSDESITNEVIDKVLRGGD